MDLSSCVNFIESYILFNLSMIFIKKHAFFKWPQPTNSSFKGGHDLLRKLDMPNRCILREVSHLIHHTHPWSHNHTDDCGCVRMPSTITPRLFQWQYFCAYVLWVLDITVVITTFVIVWCLSEAEGKLLTASCKAFVSPNCYQTTYLHCDSLLLKWSICLVWFSAISTIVCYLMPNPFLYIQRVLFQPIQFNLSK